MFYNFISITFTENQQVKKMKIHVNDNPIFDYVEVYLMGESHEKRYSITMGENGSLVKQEEPEEGQPLPAFFKMPDMLFNEFIGAILDYANDNNIEGTKESALEAKMGVMESWLDEAVSDKNKILDFILKKK